MSFPPLAPPTPQPPSPTKGFTHDAFSVGQKAHFGNGGWLREVRGHKTTTTQDKQGTFTMLFISLVSFGGFFYGLFVCSMFFRSVLMVSIFKTFSINVSFCSPLRSYLPGKYVVSIGNNGVNTT